MKEKKFKLLVLPSVSNMQQVVDSFSVPMVFTKGKFKNLEIIFKDRDIAILYEGVDLKEFSFVWLCSSWGTRDLAYAVQLYLNQNNIPSTCVEKGTSKLTDHMSFSLSGIVTPNTLFMGCKDVDKNIKQIENICKYPLIVKDTKGSKGACSIKVESRKDLLRKMKKLPNHKKYFFQQYISNDYDWGIMVSNGVVVSGEKRYSCAGEFRNNVCNGGTEVFIDPSDIPQEIKKIAINASSALGLLWSRTDILIDKSTQKPYVLEVNRFPGITSKTTEVNSAYTFLSSQVASLIK